MMKIQVIVIYKGQTYKGQTLGCIEDFCGKEVLRIINPERRSLPDMTFVGGYPNEYCIFMERLPEKDQAVIRQQSEEKNKLRIFCYDG